MYYPILKAKRHELNTLYDLASILPATKYRPVIEPVNAKYKPLIATIDQLHNNSVSPLVIINPSQGHFAKIPLRAFSVCFRLILSLRINLFHVLK